MLNPYANWNSSRSASANQGPAPSLLGALPFTNAPATAESNILTFRFTSMNPNILNCIVTGPHSQPYFRVVTDMNSSRPSTFFENANGRGIGSIRWATHPTAEVLDIIPRQPVGQWMMLSQDGRSRQMDCAGRRYVWTPNNKALCLYTTSAAPELLARISRTQTGIVELEISSHAIQQSLLEVCIVAVVLLQSGKSID